MKRFIYVCAFFLCLCSCSESKYIAEELERTQEIINDYPDSALHSLQAIVPGSIRKKSTKAHYGLLYSLALDKTGQTIDTDSMLRPAVNYFMRKGTNRQKFLSWYCLGRMEYSTNNYQKATESYLKALEYRDIIDDPYLIGVCNFVLGELNLKQNNYQRALFYYQEAYENYQAANKTKHQVSAKIAIAAVYYMENDDDNALRDYREALNLSEQFGYEDFQVYCLRCLIGILSNKGVTNETNDYVGRFLQLSDDLSPNDCCVLGEYYLRINKPDSAEYYLNAAISANIGGPRENDAAAKILLAETYTLNADYRAAYLMQKECLALCDSIHLSYMNNSAAETELRYKNERLEFERYRSSVRQNVIYIIALVSVIAICGIIYIFYRRNKMQKQRIEEYLTLIDELNKTKLQPSWDGSTHSSSGSAPRAKRPFRSTCANIGSRAIRCSYSDRAASCRPGRTNASKPVFWPSPPNSCDGSPWTPNASCNCSCNWPTTPASSCGARRANRSAITSV